MRQLIHLISIIVLSGLLAPAQPVRAVPNTVVPGGTPFGVNSNIATRYPDYQSLPVPADAVNQAGAGWAREDFQWSRIEPRPGEFSFGFHDQTVDLLTRRGITVIGVLGGPTPAWSTPGATGDSFVAPNPQRFAEFVSNVVDHYRHRVEYWEIWNEPDNRRYWQPNPDPAAYANLLNVVYPAIKAANPDAKVLLGGVVPFDLNFLRALQLYGAWNSFDIISLHPYVDPASPEAGQIAAAGVGAVKALVDTPGFGAKPIWVTEFGWATGPSDRDPAGRTNEDMQANYLVRGALLLYAAGAERVIWYNLKDDPGNPYGLYRFGSSPTDYSQPKPARLALNFMSLYLARSTLVGAEILGERRVLVDFEQFGNWDYTENPVKRANTFTQSSEQKHGGSFSAKMEFMFTDAENNFNVARPRGRIAIPEGTSQIGVWVYGSTYAHSLKVWLRDAEGEELQFRLGYVGKGWQFLVAPITYAVEPFNRISGAGDLRLTFPATLSGLVLDDDPDTLVNGSSIYLDDLTAIIGPEAYSVRFDKGGSVVDVLWSPQGGRVAIPTRSTSSTLTDRSGNNSTVTSRNGQYELNVGPSPVYLLHSPAEGSPSTSLPPSPTPVPPAPTSPAPTSGQFVNFTIGIKDATASPPPLTQTQDVQACREQVVWLYFSSPVAGKQYSLEWILRDRTTGKEISRKSLPPGVLSQQSSGSNNWRSERGPVFYDAVQNGELEIILKPAPNSGLQPATLSRPIRVIKEESFPGECAIAHAEEIIKDQGANIFNPFSTFVNDVISVGETLLGIIGIGSPAYPLVVAADGSRTGFLPDGQIVEEIPGSRAFLIDEKKVIVYPWRSDVEIQIVGYAPGSMDVYAGFVPSDGNEVLLSYLDVPVTSQMKASLRSADNDHLLQLDPDGEGTFDQSLQPTAREQVGGAASTSGEAPAPSDGSFADPAFRSVWERTDLPLANGAPGLQPRSWIWGPQPITGGMREPYAEGENGARLVQYFDKSRMEINNPDAARDQWFVTNGLLVQELIEGRVQIGNNLFEDRVPAEQAVAGDPIEINPDAPTYRSFRSVAFPVSSERASSRVGQVVTAVLNKDGTVLDNPDLARYNVTLALYEEQLGHNIPQVFRDFFNQQGVIYREGRYERGPIIDWTFVVGLPISEPYWARVKVGGVEKDVLMQAFQRRVLTYTPDNPDGFKVEMGNVGQHYLRWRYSP